MKQSQDNIFYIKNNNIVEVDEKLVQRNTPWLLNNYEDDVWKLKPHIHSDDNSRYTVNWNIFDINDYIGVFNRWDYWKSAAKELTKYTKEKSGLETILLKLPFSHSVNGTGEKSFYLTTNGLYMVLRYFANSAKFNRVDLRPHMFRRAYAMLWTWRYEIGDLEELRLMLKHNSLNFTQKYTDDENVWEFMGKNEQDLAFDLLNRAFQRKIVVAGKMSETLERYSRIIQAKSTLLDAVTIADHIDDIIINTGLRVVAHADGFCFINHTSLENALCRTEGIGLDPVKRKDTICMNCPNFATDNSRKPYWEKRIKLHQEFVESSKNEQLIEGSKQFIKEAEKILKDIA